ncbi:MAG: hypothetical protein EXR75_04025 [Myxococcales bacterium]|nr:hypothetical protein [Myxococcales bacterium]
MCSFDRHRANRWRAYADDDPSEEVPGKSFLEGVPDSVRGTMLAALRAVAEAPPPSFSGGGYWEAMHEEMAGYFMDKAFRTTFSKRDYTAVRLLGDEYRKRDPRRVLR